MYPFSLTITREAHKQPNLLDWLLQNLDPSLFQNIILGVLAIFIPFAIVFLTDIISSKKRKISEFEKMVFNDEVFGMKKIFVRSIIGIIVFAFLNGKDISNFAKIFAIVVVIALALFYWFSFKAILKFSEGDKSGFEISFLEKLSFSNLLTFKNKSNEKKMLQSWKSVLAKKSEINEEDFTGIFISHIDDAIKFGKLNLAVDLAKTYVDNIDKRYKFFIRSLILSQVFKWSKIFWDKQNLSHTMSDSEYVDKWSYFNEEFFQAIIKTLLEGKQVPHELFNSFKQHIEDIEKKEGYDGYIDMLFKNFCQIFFNKIASATSIVNHTIWKFNFPYEWKVTIENKDSIIPQLIVNQFMVWSENRIFKKQNEDGHDQDLTDVINGIFPNIHSSLLIAFLMLFWSSESEVKNVLERESNFDFDKTEIANWAKHVVGKTSNLDEIYKEQKKHTIQVILTFFKNWSPLTVYNKDLSESESNYTEEQKKIIATKIQTMKLEKIKQEIESEEIKNICENFTKKKPCRKDFLELIELLILEINPTNKYAR